MKIKTDDLRMLMDYLDKELVEDVDVTVVVANFAVYADFKDADNRECQITLYDADMINKTPSLQKKMELLTRIKKETQ